MDLIMERRSVRSYSAKPVSAEAVTALLRAAMAAPSACNQQPWRFTVVRRQDLKERLAAASPFCRVCGPGSGYSGAGFSQGLPAAGVCSR